MKNTLNIWRNPIHLLAFGLGSGLAPWAPGTAGTLAAVVLYLLFPPMHWALYGVMLVVTFVFGVWICEQTSRALGVHDHGGIVWDEFVGYWTTMFLAPEGWQWVVGGFLLFRLLDILKPWPIRLADSRVKGGFGIMLDDVIAGIIAAACLQAVAVLLVAGQ